MNVYPYGHDFGNSETCAVMLSPGWMEERRIPSVTAPGSWKKVQEMAAGTGITVRDSLSAGHYVLEYDHEAADGTRYHVEKIVGQKVFDDGGTPGETRGDDARYWLNNYNLEALMVGSASMRPDAEYRLHVVTGLPIAAYSQESASLVRSALQGVHLFWLNGSQRIMYVESVRVIMEGAGALIAYGSDDPTVLQGVIDIGGQTTDLCLARGQKPLTNLCKGKSLGVAAASDRFNQKFREAHGRDLSLTTRMELLRQHVGNVPYRAVKDRHGDVVDSRIIGDLIARSLQEIGQEIATFVAATWNDYLLDCDRVLLVGGGAHYFAAAIAARLKSATAPAKPEMANAAGYAALAEAIAERARSLHIAS